MPRPSKGIRLWLRPEERDAANKVIRRPQWVIIEGRKYIPTGCFESEREKADLFLAEYLQSRYEPERIQRKIADIPVVDVINIYVKDKLEPASNNKKALERALRLGEWWADKTLDQVSGVNCRAYAKHREEARRKEHEARQARKPHNQRIPFKPSTLFGGARRDLQDLSAAIQHHHKEGFHREHVRVWLPERGEGRERFLTRKELAALVLTAWRMREQQRREHAPGQKAKGVATPTAKRTGRHIARAILFAYYTGSRIGDVLRASWKISDGVSYLNLDAGIFHRRPRGKRSTKKRQPTIRLSQRLLSHLRRWQRTGVCKAFVVEWEGKPVQSIKAGFGTAVRVAKLEGKISPHTLRHSRATHLKQASITSWEVGEYLGMSEKMVEQTYGHHDPNNMSRAANAR